MGELPISTISPVRAASITAFRARRVVWFVCVRNQTDDFVYLVHLLINVFDDLISLSK